jgi:hypothetical protein
MKKHYASTAMMMGFLWLVSFVACAQANFKPGYIVPINGDTVRGEIQIKGALRNTTSCRFRPLGSTQVTEYVPATLRGYGISRVGVYEARQLPGSPAQVLFLELLAAGRARLYTRRDDEDQTHYYLAVGQDSLQELRQLRVRRIVNDQVYYEDQYPFRNVLAKAFHDCLVVQPLLVSLPFTPQNLARVVNRYNECTSTPATASSKPLVNRERQHLRLGLVAALEHTSMKFGDRTSLHNGSFSTSATPVVGAFLMLTTPALNRNLAFRLDVLYEHLSYDDTYVTRDFSTVDLRQRASFTANYVKLPVQVRYYLPTGRVRPYIQAGILFNYLVAYKSYFRSEYNTANSTSTLLYEGVPIDSQDMTHAEIGVVGGLGLEATALAGRIISVEARVEHGSGFVETSSINAPIVRVGVFLSVSLTK